MLKSLHWRGFVVAFAIASAAASAQSGPDFGEPPSGTIPILFNDHHVYARPSALQSGRVIAALVRGDEVLVPLRSLFEQMGATVNYDGPSRTVVVLAPQRNISLVVDQPLVVINGESRPLDVPPVIVNGILLVPVRVISEALGAYVQWDAALRVVVIRYLNYSNVPSPSGPLVTPVPVGPVSGPAPVATPIPTPLFGAPPTKSPYEHFVAGDYNFYSKTSNELSPGNTGKSATYDARLAVEFPLFKAPWMLEGDYRSFSYPHNDTIDPDLIGEENPCPHFGGFPPFPAAGNQGCVTEVGHYGQTPVQSFTAQEAQLDARFGLKLFDPRIYLAVDYLSLTHDYGQLYDYPTLHGFGLGLEKLPDLDQKGLSLYASAYYHPSMYGKFTYPEFDAPLSSAGMPSTLHQQAFTYQGGINVPIAKPIFLDIGVLGDMIRARSPSPSSVAHTAAYAGLGLHF
jgi:hypothetical protein